MNYFHWHSEREVRTDGARTPPHDNIGLEPRLLRTPRESHMSSHHPTAVATRQACAVSMSIACVSLLVFGLVGGLVALATTVIGQRSWTECSSQRIDNGIFLPARLNKQAVPKCDKGYVLRAQPPPSITCLLISEHCVVLKAATETEPAQTHCNRKFAFTTQAASNHSLAVTKADNGKEPLRDFDEPYAIAGQLSASCCILEEEVMAVNDIPINASEPELYSKVKPGHPVPVNASKSQLYTKNMPGHPVQSPGWTTVATGSLLLGSLSVLVASGVQRGRGMAPVVDGPDCAPLADIEQS